MLGQLVKIRAQKFGEGWLLLNVAALIFSLCAITTRDWGVLEKHRPPQLQKIIDQPRPTVLLDTVINFYAGLSGMEYYINQTVAIRDPTGRAEDYYYKSWSTQLSQGFMQCRDLDVAGSPMNSTAPLFGPEAESRVAGIPFYVGGCYNLFWGAIGIYVLVSFSMLMNCLNIFLAVLVIRRAGRYRDPNRHVVRLAALLGAAVQAGFVGVWRGKYVVDLDHFIRASNPAATFSPHWPGYSACLQLASVGLTAAALFWVFAADNSALWMQLLRNVAIGEDEKPTVKLPGTQWSDQPLKPARRDILGPGPPIYRPRPAKPAAAPPAPVTRPWPANAVAPQPPPQQQQPARGLPPRPPSSAGPSAAPAVPSTAQEVIAAALRPSSAARATPAQLAAAVPPPAEPEVVARELSLYPGGDEVEGAPPAGSPIPDDAGASPEPTTAAAAPSARPDSEIRDLASPEPAEAAPPAPAEVAEAAPLAPAEAAPPAPPTPDAGPAVDLAPGESALQV